MRPCTLWGSESDPPSAAAITNKVRPVSRRHAKLAAAPPSGPQRHPVGSDALVSEYAELEARQAAFLAEARRFVSAIVRAPPAPPRGAGVRVDLRALLASYERALILWALAKAGGQQLEAARLLCLRPTTLNEKIKRLQIGRPKHA